MKADKNKTPREYAKNEIKYVVVEEIKKVVTVDKKTLVIEKEFFLYSSEIFDDKYQDTIKLKINKLWSKTIENSTIL